MDDPRDFKTWLQVAKVREEKRLCKNFYRDVRLPILLCILFPMWLLIQFVSYVIEIDNWLKPDMP